MSVDVLVLAGGSLKGFATAKVASKGLIEVGGKPMIEYLIDTLRTCPSTGELVVALPSRAPQVAWAGKVDKILVGDGTLIENIEMGIKFLGTKAPILITSSDIPLLRSEAVEDFLERCRSKEGDFFYPVVSREELKKQFPQTKRTYATLREGTFTGGNLVLVEPRVFLENVELTKRMYEARKSPVEMARILGIKFIFKFLLRLLTIKETEERVSSLIGARGRAIITPYAEIAVDVDKDTDLELVRSVLVSGQVEEGEG